ncbi:Exoribonuclease II [Forsythia ovata]|uniref:Exoribonuclease II n=1 Tax=Forsythia ovata TaxID=205694 RepID=A0ABD1SLP8_9LAMI
MASIKPQQITFIVPGVKNFDHTEILDFVKKAQSNLDLTLLEFAWIELFEKNKSVRVEELSEAHSRKQQRNLCPISLHATVTSPPPANRSPRSHVHAGQDTQITPSPNHTTRPRASKDNLMVYDPSWFSRIISMR